MEFSVGASFSRSLFYSSDTENEVNKVIIVSLTWEKRLTIAATFEWRESKAKRQ